MDTFKFLKNVFLFNRLTDDELVTISSVCAQLRLSKNKIVFNEAEPASAFFVIVHGSLKIFKITPEGNEVTIHIQRAMDLVAEAAIFDNEIYPAYCKAIEDSLLIKIPKTSFIDLINKNPNIAIKMLAAYSKRLRGFVSVIEKMNNSDIKQRLAQYLIEHTKQENGKNIVTLDITKKDLASLLGTTPETISRTLSLFKKERLISESTKKIAINSLERLKKNYLQNS